MIIQFLKKGSVIFLLLIFNIIYYHVHQTNILIMVKKKFIFDAKINETIRLSKKKKCLIIFLLLIFNVMFTHILLIYTPLPGFSLWPGLTFFTLSACLSRVLIMNLKVKSLWIRKKRARYIFRLKNWNTRQKKLIFNAQANIKTKKINK